MDPQVNYLQKIDCSFYARLHQFFGPYDRKARKKLAAAHGTSWEGLPGHARTCPHHFAQHNELLHAVVSIDPYYPHSVQWWSNMREVVHVLMHLRAYLVLKNLWDSMQEKLVDNASLRSLLVLLDMTEGSRDNIARLTEAPLSPQCYRNQTAYNIALNQGYDITFPVGYLLNELKKKGVATGLELVLARAGTVADLSRSNGELRDHLGALTITGRHDDLSRAIAADDWPQLASLHLNALSLNDDLVSALAQSGREGKLPLLQTLTITMERLTADGAVFPEVSLQAWEAFSGAFPGVEVLLKLRDVGRREVSRMLKPCVRVVEVDVHHDGSLWDLEDVVRVFVEFNPSQLRLLKARGLRELPSEISETLMRCAPFTHTKFTTAHRDGSVTTTVF